MTDNAKKFPVHFSDNARLLEQIYPGGYQNPTPEGKYNLVVIGAGTAGLVTAAAAAQMGAKVALIEKQHMGGDCLNLGCVPSKVIISDARKMHAVTSITPGVSWADRRVYFEQSLARMRKLRANIAKVDSVERFSKLGVDVYLGHGQFTSPDRIQVGEQSLSFVKAVIATGGKPRSLIIQGISSDEYLTNETVFSLEALPKTMVVIGSGPTGCEMAQTFARFGTEVTVVTLDEAILPNDDPEMAKVVQDQCTKDGVVFEFNAAIDKVTKHDGQKKLLLKNGITIEFEQMLVSVGRLPNLLGFGLQEANIQHSDKGIDVNEKLQTTNPNVFAIGDVATPFKFTHVADEMARVVVQNALFPVSRKMKDVLIPWVTYTDPELAYVFPQYSDLNPEDCEKIEINLLHNDRSLLEGRTDGKMFVYLHPTKGHIIGGHIVGPHAGELIGQISLAASQKLKPKSFASIVYAYPTQSAVFRNMGDLARKDDFKPLFKKILNALWSWQRGNHS